MRTNLILTKPKFIILILFTFILSNFILAQQNPRAILKYGSVSSTVMYEWNNGKMSLGGNFDPSAKFHFKGLQTDKCVIKAVMWPNYGTDSTGSVENCVYKGLQYYGIYQTGPPTGSNYFQNPIGIGTEDPKFKLQVDGDIGCSSTMNFLGIEPGIIITSDRPLEVPFTFQYNYLSTPSGDPYIPMIIHHWGAEIGGRLECDAFMLRTDPGIGKILASDENGNGIWTDGSRFHDNDWLVYPPAGKDNQVYLYSNPDYKGVGIGTDTPEDIFQVNDGFNKLTIGSAIGEVLHWGTSYIGFNASRLVSSWKITTDHAHNGGAAIFGDIFGNIRFATVPTLESGTTDQYISDAEMLTATKMIISKDGDVGICTGVQSGYKLAVNGKILCTELKVQLEEDWGDYVFDKSYKLMPLYDVEKFIIANRHLPEAPSSDVVKSEGLKLGEMNAILMKKVEELTLYIIDQQKQIDELKSMVLNK